MVYEIFWSRFSFSFINPRTFIPLSSKNTLKKWLHSIQSSFELNPLIHFNIMYHYYFEWLIHQVPYQTTPQIHDSLDQCPMPINSDQNIDSNDDRYRSMIGIERYLGSMTGLRESWNCLQSISEWKKKNI